MQELINIVEPTLKDETGHCMSFVNSLISTTSNIQFQIWADRNCKTENITSSAIVKKYFSKTFRKFQCLLLYRKLLSTPNKTFIATASRLDLMIFDWVARYQVPGNKIYFYFHWMNADPKKKDSLRILAKRQPGFVIIAPTQSVARVFQEAGFNNVKLAPYPTQNILHKSKNSKKFTHAWYAGAARTDKGFGRVVDLIGLVQKQHLDIPFVVQASPDHHGKYDIDIVGDIARLKDYAYPHVKICDETLSSEQYQSYFEGSVCIQAYSAKDFADRVSGVTLDALLAGCPIISGPGTWTANQVIRFNAGVILEDTSPQAMLAALVQVINKYDFYCTNAMLASEMIRKEHEASHLANAILCENS